MSAISANQTVSEHEISNTAPWQCGSNENMNGLLRDYRPKATDLRQVALEELTCVADEINHPPRKTLAWARPADLLTETAAASA